MHTPAAPVDNTVINDNEKLLDALAAYPEDKRPALTAFLDEHHAAAMRVNAALRTQNPAATTTPPTP